MVRLPRNEKQTRRLNSRPQMWPSVLTLAMTLTLNFQGQMWNSLYLSQKWSDCQETNSKHIDWSQDLKCDHWVWPWTWSWSWIFKIKYGIGFISAQNGPIATKWKANTSIELLASNVTIIFDLDCDLDLEFSRWNMNFYIAIKTGPIATKRKANILIWTLRLKYDQWVWPYSRDNFWTTFWISFIFGYNCWPWPIDYLIRFWSIFVVTLTLNFQGQIWNLLYLSQKWSDCHETKSKHVDWTLGLKCDHRFWPWPWPWPWIFKVKCGIRYILVKNGPIARKRKANKSIDLRTSNVTIGFDLGHDLDTEFSRSNMELAISLPKMVRLPQNEKQTHRLNSWPQMWPSDLTLAVTLTLNF